jgi:hypothetical protein
MNDDRWAPDLIPSYPLAAYPWWPLYGVLVGLGVGFVGVIGVVSTAVLASLWWR